MFVLPRKTGVKDKNGGDARANPMDVYNEMKSVLTPSCLPSS